MDSFRCQSHADEELHAVVNICTAIITWIRGCCSVVTEHMEDQVMWRILTKYFQLKMTDIVHTYALCSMLAVLTDVS